MTQTLEERRQKTGTSQEQPDFPTPQLQGKTDESRQDLMALLKKYDGPWTML